jgi:YbbR domain-containing protein
MNSIKKIFKDWQWVLSLIVLLYGIFLFYYQSSVSIPDSIQDCQHRLDVHLAESTEHFHQLDKSVAELNVVNAGISAQLSAIKEDTTITKKLVFELLGKRL